MNDNTAVQILADFAVRARTHPLPTHVLVDAGTRVLDVLGNSLAAHSLPGDEPHEALLRVLRPRGGAAQAGVLGTAIRLPAPDAALVNGTLAHALDFDDTHLPSILHPSCSVVPAALAVAELVDATGADLLAAVAVGIEVTNRLGMASYSPELRNSVFFENGLHATSICGTIGAAAAAAMLLGLDRAGTASAMGIAASMGAGLLEANRTGGSVKRIHAGWAAHSGVEAALFAAAGITGPPTVLEGRFGFLRAYVGEAARLEEVTEGLGDRWELLRTVYKPYPANHFTHPAIDCALALRAGGLDPARIASVQVGVAEAPFRTIAEPRAEKVNPRTPYHAKFSAPYTVATTLLGGGGLGVYLDDFTEQAFADPARRALAERVSVVVDEQCSAEFPNAFSAVMRVRLHDDTTLEHRVHSSRGGPEHPLSLADLETKFRLNAGQVLDPEQVETLRNTVTGLIEAPTVHALVAQRIAARTHAGDRQHETLEA